MPSIRRLPPARREHTELSEVMAFAFVYGPLMEETDASIADAWQVFGPAFLERFIVDAPGRRPWVWWMNEAPEPRQVNPFYQGAHKVTEEDLRRGGAQLVSDGLGGWTHLLETEDAYLERLGLWLKGERERFGTKS